MNREEERRERARMASALYYQMNRETILERKRVLREAQRGESMDADDESGAVAPVSLVKRGRGRPPKYRFTGREVIESQERRCLLGGDDSDCGEGGEV